jgi:dihydroorotase
MTLIKNCIIVNEGNSFKGSVLIKGKIISKIFEEEDLLPESVEIIDANGLIMLPGVIDDQVHFREPGSTHKGDIASESAAAVLGGVTSYMEMPNTNPPATTRDLLEEKYRIAKKSSFANYSFYLGGTNNNLAEIINADPSSICGIKLFMGSSTGNMLVDNDESLEAIFKNSPMLIAAHCEDENTIQTNMQNAKEMYGDDIPFSLHPIIRSREACIKSSEKAINLALKYNSSLHILHISTKDEIDMIHEASKKNPKITGEVCVHYMLFDNKLYCEMGSKIKCNPAIKTNEDKESIINAVKHGIIKVVATDHAPHTIDDKNNKYLTAPSGLPLIQHSLQIMWELHLQGHFSIEEIADRMSHSPAIRFGVEKRGFIREGYFADIVLVDPNKSITVDKSNINYKCKWSPFEGETFRSSIVHTFVNGKHAVAFGKLTGNRAGERLKFLHEK